MTPSSSLTRRCSIRRRSCTSGFEACARRGRVRISAASTPMLIGGRDERAPRQFAVHSPIDTRIVLGRFQAGEDVARASAAVAAASAALPAWAATPWPERVRLLRRAVELIEDARLLHWRGARARGRQESDGGARRGAGNGRPHRVLLRRRWSATTDYVQGDGCAIRCRASSARTVSVLQALRRMARDRAVQFSARARRRVRPARRWWPATPSFSRRRRPRRGAAGCWPMRCATRACRPGVFNFVTGPGGSLGEALVRHPDVAGVTFTGSYERRHASVPDLRAEAAGRGRASRRWAARTRRSSRGTRICRRGRDRRRAFGVRAVGAEMLGVLARVRRAHGVYRLRRRAARGDGEDRRRRPDAARALDGPGDRRGRRGALRRRGGANSRARRRRAASCMAASASTTAISRMATIVRRRSRARRCRILCGRRELFAPFVLVAPVATLDEALAHANASDYGLTAGFYGDRRRRPSAFSRGSKRACATRTGRRARPPARGPAISRSAAGRARARPARRAARSTTCRNTCASSRRRACGAGRLLSLSQRQRRSRHDQRAAGEHVDRQRLARNRNPHSTPNSGIRNVTVSARAGPTSAISLK